ncbi:HYR domain-containing protein [Methylobacterium currus]|uniref:HYR domain-containing protein n=1 Tax=Methylobacterium currus TaxID=2051553 RepID=A0A2R4WNB6_9HYPH|nr:tail fiber protein [Methylobacterium currus]AWB23036.1 HYR domain-containing protein [Methylobacterium currus]
MAAAPFDNRQASLALTQVILTNGYFPSRDDGYPTAGQGGTLGSIRTFATTFDPAPATNGQLLSISQNSALYALLGVTYGGDGRTSFNLPNLQGRTIVGASNSSAYFEGSVNGAVLTSLNASQIPGVYGGGNSPFDNQQPSLGLYYGIQSNGDGYSTITGEVSGFASSYIPQGFIPADGRALSIADYPALFAVLGTTYGGDGRTTFNVPNLVGRDIVGVGPQTTLGQSLGQANLTLSPSQLPSEAKYGGGQPIDNRSPGLVLNYIISLNGIYPQRDGSGLAEDFYVGEVRVFAGDASQVPSGWMLAQGQTLPISPYQALYSLLGTTFGGNGSSNFQLPDLRDRVVVGRGTDASSGTTYALGDVNGSNFITLTYAQVPDSTAPVITVPSGNQTISATSASGAAVSFAVTAADNLDASAPTLTYFETVNGQTRQVTSGSIFGLGLHTITATAQDQHGNVGSRTYAFTVADTTPPDTTIQGGPASLSSSSSATFSFIGTDNISPAGSLTYAVSLDGSAFVVATNPLTYTGLADGSHTFQVRSVDAAGNVDPTPAVYTWTVDATPPNVAGISPSVTGPTNATSLTQTVTFSEAVTGVDAGDFALTGTGTAAGTIASVTGSGTTYTVTLAGVTGDGTLRLDLKGAGTGIQDAAGNAATGFTAGGVTTLDHTAPIVAGLTTATTGPTNATSLTYALAFSEAVTGLDAGDFTLRDADGRAVTGATVGNPVSTDGGRTYGVTVSGVSTNGPVHLDLNATGTGIQDAVGNPLTGGAAGTSVTLDQIAPTLAISSSASALRAGQSATVSFTFSEDPGASFVRDDITVTGGTLSELSGSGLVRTATFTPAAGVNAGTAAITVAAGTYLDAAGNPGGAGTTPPLTFDTLAPLVAGLTAAATSPKASTLTYTLAFSEVVTGLDASDFTLRDASGSLIAGATIGTPVSADGGKTYSVPVAGLSSFNGLLHLDLNASGTGIQDAVGNLLVGGATGTSVTLAHAPLALTDDFNGDGKSDILWRNTDGTLVEWEMDSAALISGGAIGNDPNWSVVGTGDFNGDGRTDILQRDARTGHVLQTLMDGRTILSAQVIGGDQNWSVVGTGDFNGDGKSDVLWRNTDGTLVEREMDGAALIGSGVLGNDPNWSVVGTGDFNGDGMTDILQRDAQTGHVLQTLMSGGTALSAQVIGGDLSWNVVGIGDFDADGKSDVLWRNINGTLIYQDTSTRDLISGKWIGADPSWNVVGTGDFNGDGRSDILQRNAVTGYVLESITNGQASFSSLVVGGGPDWNVVSGQSAHT